MSDLERAVLLEFDGMDEVVDIREQYPLPQSSTLRLANQAGIRHPHVKGVDIVMTTDFYVDVKVGKRRSTVAVAVKYADDLNDRRTIEKLEIERRYWFGEKTRWVLVTELDLRADRTAVALWRHGWHTFDHLNEPPEYWAARCDTMLAALGGAGDAPLLDIIRSLECDGDFATGDGLTIIRHLLATGALELVGERGFDPRGPAAQLIPKRVASDTGRNAA
ncbi:MAG: TnsA endonuclease N-terminal domain-containing protein [Methylovirgula sp.]